jgi:dTDP-L-rhamnose 4-epimerase
VGHRPSQVLLTSSRAVYGEGEWQREDGSRWYPGQRSHAQLEGLQWDFPQARGLAARADLTAPAPTSVYGATKLTQEHILSAWALSNGVPLSIFRLQNVYGPGQSLTNSYTGIVTLFSRLARRQETIPLYEDGEITRDFVYIDDVANAVAAGLRQPPADVRLLDVGSGVPTTIGDLAREMAKYHGAPEPVVVEKFRDGDVRHALADISATREALQWAPQVDVGTGVANLQVWVEREEQELR